LIYVPHCPTNKLARLLFIFLIVSYVAVGGLIQSLSASAQEQKGCSASINGFSVNGETIKVHRDEDATIEVSVPAGAVQNTVYVEFFGKRWEIDSTGPAQGGWSTTVPVKKYAIWGVGLYKLVWDSVDDTGRVLCRESASIQVKGFPLATVAGSIGSVAMAVGLVGLGFTLRTTIYEGARWAIKVIGRGEVEREEKEETEGKRKGSFRLKPTVSISQSLLGTVWGVLMGGGTLAILQETAISLPTIELALELVLPFTVFGLLAGLFRMTRE